MANPFERIDYALPSYSYLYNRDQKGGLAGVTAAPNQLYRYLKSSPYTDIDVRDPISQPVARIKTENFRHYVDKMYDRFYKTERQIRYNETTGSGNYRQYTQGFDFLTDYHRLVAPYTSRSYLFYLFLAVGGYIVVKKLI